MKAFQAMLCGGILMAATPAWAGDLAAGKATFTAMGCVGCHGVNGISVDPTYPTLRGKDEAFVKANLKDFRSGKRVSAIKNVITHALSDKDIDNLATFVASLSKP